MSTSKAQTTRADYNIYAQQLALLGYGVPLWQPAPLNDYKRVKLADVGYIRTGSFHRLFNASLPAHDPAQTRGVPENFEQLQLDGTSSEEKQPRVPGALHSRHMRLKGVDIDLAVDPAWIEAGATVHFESSSDEGAMLVTKDITLREDALQLGFLETYILKNHESWLDMANVNLGRGIKLEDLILVTGYDLTSQFAMAAFSDGSREHGIRFKAAYPSVASASVSVWGQWHTTTSVYQNFGPQIPRLPSAIRSSDSLSVAQPRTVTPIGASSRLASDYDQCVFLRGFRIRKRARLFPKVLRAGAGPHDLGSGHRDDENTTDVRRAEHATDAGLEDQYQKETIVEPVANKQPFEDPLEPYFHYIFKNSDAQTALVHDYDITALLKADAGLNFHRDIASLIQSHAPEIIRINDGVARIRGSLQSESSGRPKSVAAPISSPFNSAQSPHKAQPVESATSTRKSGLEKSRTRVLVTGLRRSGKTSILKVVFANSPAKNTFFLESTTKVSKTCVDSVIPLEFWDCPGNLPLENVRLQQFSTLLFIIDIQDNFNHSIARLVETVIAVTKENPDINIEVFVHKAEALSDDYKTETYRHVQERVFDELEDMSVNVDGLDLRFHLTSIYDHSVYESLSNVVQKLIDPLPYLEDLLNAFCANSQLSKAFIFDTQSRIYVATDASPVDVVTHNLCCDYVHMLSQFTPLYQGNVGTDSRNPTRWSNSTVHLTAGTTLAYWQITSTLAVVVLVPTKTYEARRGLVEYNLVFFKEGVQEILDVEAGVRHLNPHGASDLLARDTESTWKVVRGLQGRGEEPDRDKSGDSIYSN